MPVHEQTARNRERDREAEAFLAELEHVTDIPTLPVVAVKLNNLLQDPEITIKDVCGAIEKDQAIVSRLLRLVNSAFYGFRARIDTIPHAVSLLGFNTVRNAVFSIAIIRSFSGRSAVDYFDIKEFWKHSVAVAVTGRHLATRNSLCAADEAFVAGILHDVGKVVLAQFFQDLFDQVLHIMDRQGLTFGQAEGYVLPADHARIGQHMAQKWQLPSSLIEAVAYHHDTEKAGSENGLPMITHLSDLVVNNYLNTLEEMPDLFGISPQALKLLETDPESLCEWLPAVRNDIDSACDFFLEEEP